MHWNVMDMILIALKLNANMPFAQQRPSSFINQDHQHEHVVITKNEN